MRSKRLTLSSHPSERDKTAGNFGSKRRKEHWGRLRIACSRAVKGLVGQFPKGLGSDECEIAFFFLHRRSRGLLPLLKGLANQMGKCSYGMVEKLDSLWPWLTDCPSRARLESRERGEGGLSYSHLLYSSVKYA